MDERNKIEKVLARVAKKYKVEEATSVTDNELTAFFKNAYSGYFDSEIYKNEEEVIRRWKWANLKNPEISINQFPAWMCREAKSGKIIGHFAVMPISLKFKGSLYSAVWGRDLITLPKFRKLGIGPLLVDDLLKNTKSNQSAFLIAGLNNAGYPMFKKLGFSDFGYIPLYVRINRLGDIINVRIRNRILANFLKIIGEILLSILYIPFNLKGLKAGMNPDIRIKEIKSFDSSFDKLWEKASLSFSIIVKRDSARLNWRFINQPYWKYKIFKAENNHVLKGYVVVREGRSRGMRTGIITDLFADANDEKTITLLISFAIKYFKNKPDIGLIRCDMLNKTFEKALKTFGFMKIRSSSHFMVNNISKQLDREFMLNRDNWFINYADCDLDLAGRR